MSRNPSTPPGSPKSSHSLQRTESISCTIRSVAFRT